MFSITLRLYKIGRLKPQSLGCLLHILKKELQNLKNGATERNRYSRNVERGFRVNVPHIRVELRICGDRAPLHRSISKRSRAVWKWTSMQSGNVEMGGAARNDWAEGYCVGGWIDYCGDDSDLPVKKIFMLIRLVDFLETYFEPSFSWGAATGAGSFNFNLNKLFLPSLGTRASGQS